MTVPKVTLDWPLGNSPALYLRCRPRAIGQVFFGVIALPAALGVAHAHNRVNPAIESARGTLSQVPSSSLSTIHSNPSLHPRPRPTLISKLGTSESTQKPGHTLELLLSLHRTPPSPFRAHCLCCRQCHPDLIRRYSSAGHHLAQPCPSAPRDGSPAATADPAVQV